MAYLHCGTDVPSVTPHITLQSQHLVPLSAMEILLLVPVGPVAHLFMLCFFLQKIKSLVWLSNLSALVKTLTQRFGWCEQLGGWLCDFHRFYAFLQVTIYYFRNGIFKDQKEPNRLRETMPYKNVIAIDFVEELITMNWQGNDLILNIEDCNIQE